jgi:hypothetical protein
MLTLQLLVPESFPRRIQNTDLLQNIALGSLGEFVSGARKLRCVFAPQAKGQISVLAPLTVARGLTWAARRLHAASLEDVANRLYGACLPLAPDRRADVVLAHGLLPLFPALSRRKRPPVLWGPGYVHDDCYATPPSLATKAATDARN